MSVMRTDELLFEEKQLFVPSLSEIKTVLENGLKNNFQDVDVDVIDCPNLQEAPFHLASKGLSGCSRLLEIGGPPYLLPLVDRSKVYNLKEICEKLCNKEGKKDFLAIGAGAGPWPLINQNCEGIFNLRINNGVIINNSHLAKVNNKNECELMKIPNDNTNLALLANIFLTEGKQDKVLKVHCKKRIGDHDFITSIRETLKKNYDSDKTIGLGGVFLLKSGKARQHVMQDFSKTPITNETELNSWLKFYEMPAELIAVGTLVTNDAVNLDLRLQHFHSFSTNGWGGHYHNDTTPEIVEYLGYFTTGEKIVRIDKPSVTHQFGRD